MLNELGLMFTERCNASCRHCLLRGNDYVGSRDMSLEHAFNFIDQMAALSKAAGKLFAVCFTGGEVFLRYDDLVKAVSHAQEKGATKVSCLTNGFWGKDKANAVRWLTRLRDAGLASLTFSIDDFHQEYIPLHDVLNAFEAAQVSGLNLAVKCAVTRETRRLPEVIKDLGDLLLNATITFQEIACVPDGRAEKTISADEWLVQVMPQYRCLVPVMLYIMPDGTTFPCCGSGLNRWLRLGNALEVPLVELMEMRATSAVFNAVCDVGPAFFVSYFRDAGYTLPQEGYVSLCHLCKTVLTHSGAEQVLEKALADWRVIRVKKSMVGLLTVEENLAENRLDTISQSSNPCAWFLRAVSLYKTVRDNV